MAAFGKSAPAPSAPVASAPGVYPRTITFGGPKRAAKKGLKVGRKSGIRGKRA